MRLKRIPVRGDVVSAFFGDVRRFFRIERRRGIIEWAEAKIDYTGMPDYRLPKFDIAFSPHLREPLEACEYEGKGLKKTVVMAFSQQMGKTAAQVVVVLYHIDNRPSTVFVCYPSETDMKKMNNLKYDPVIRKIPTLAPDLLKPNAKNAERYQFKDSKLWFTSAGTQVKGVTAPLVIGDEIDQYPVIGAIDNVSELEKRSRSFDESLFLIACSPYEEHGHKGRTWEYFLKGSQGFYTLRCPHCQELTLRSCNFNLLQFDQIFDEKRQAYVVDPASLVLVCPKCKAEIAETHRSWCIDNGSYIHEFPELIERRPSFQAGMLAYKGAAGAWLEIAEKILECGKRADIAKHYELASLKGLPYVPVRVTDKDLRNLQTHFYTHLPERDKIECVFMVSDTQDTFSPTGVFAWDIHDNLWLLEYRNLDYLLIPADEREKLDFQRREAGEAPAAACLDYLDREFLPDGAGVGIRPLLHVIDCKGHRTREVQHYAGQRKNILMYSGALLRREIWTLSKNVARTALVSAKHFQTELIYYLYSQKDKEQNYLYLPSDLPESVLEEISCVQPDNSRKFGHLPDNWVPKHDAAHDAFDVLKMAYFARDFIGKNFSRNRFLRCESPLLRRRFKEKSVDQVPKEKNAPRSSGGWISGGGGAW